MWLEQFFHWLPLEIVQFLQFASGCFVLSDLAQSPWHIEKKNKKKKTHFKT